MKSQNNNMQNKNQIKAQIKKILDDMIECTHITSNFKVKAYIKRGMSFEIGQVVLLEYRTSSSGSGYIVLDPLMEEIEATVIEAQHIIDNGMMYTSLIMENPLTKERMHSLVPSTNKLFGNTSIIITGDKVKMRVNNGNLFSITY